MIKLGDILSEVTKSIKYTKPNFENEWEEASDPKSWTNLLMPRATSANKETGIPGEAG